MRKRTGRPPRFAAVPNETIDDAASLDLPALGLLTVLLRHRDGWEISTARIGAKYGHGEDAMATMMGALQVSRYVVKIRTMAVAGNRWSTDVYVFDTPASGEEIAALIAEAEADSEVRRAQYIEPTKTAVAKAAKRRAKLAQKAPAAKARKSAPAAAPAPARDGADEPRVGETPDSGPTCDDAAPDSGKSPTRSRPAQMPFPDSGVSRDSGDPRVPKKTVCEKTKDPSVRPLSGAGDVHENGGTDGGNSPDLEDAPPAAKAPAAPRPVEVTPGTELLTAIAAGDVRYQMTGTALADQGAVVTDLLERGFTEEQVRAAVTGPPWPSEIRTSPAAVIAWRLRELARCRPHIPAPARSADSAQLPPDCGAHDENLLGVGELQRRMVMLDGRLRPCPDCHPRANRPAAPAPF